MEDKLHPVQTIGEMPSLPSHEDHAGTKNHECRIAERASDYPAHDAGAYDEFEHDHAHDVCAVAEASIFGDQQHVFATLKHTVSSDLGFRTYCAAIKYTAGRARRYSEFKDELKRTFRASHTTRIMVIAKLADEQPSYYLAMLDEFGIQEARNARSRRVALIMSVARLCTAKAGEKLGEAYEYTRLAEEVIGGFKLCVQKNVVVSFDNVDTIRSVVAEVTSAELMKIGKEVIANEIMPPIPIPPAGKSDTGKDHEDAEIDSTPGREAPAAAPNNQHVQSERELQAGLTPAAIDDTSETSKHGNPQPGVVSQERAIAFADVVNSFARKQACSNPILLFGLPRSNEGLTPIYREVAGGDFNDSEPLRAGELNLHSKDQK